MFSTQAVQSVVKRSAFIVGNDIQTLQLIGLNMPEGSKRVVTVD